LLQRFALNQTPEKFWEAPRRGASQNFSVLPKKTQQAVKLFLGFVLLAIVVSEIAPC